MSGKRMHQLNIRLDHENFTLLSQISKDTKQSPSTVGAQIVSQWIEFYYYKIHRGDVIFSKQVLRNILSILDKSKIDRISKSMAKHIIKEIKLQEGTVTYPILVERILKWNNLNHLSINRIKQGNNNHHNDDCCSDVFVSKHSLGCNWSELESKTYANTFEMVGQLVISNDYDEDMFCIKVANKSNM